ncbi:MAG: ABC transporter ATP-binding protein [Burkholderiales bacterium]|nr:ABC transporter ATP-binding protein [Burkholderiales bacterium]
MSHPLSTSRTRPPFVELDAIAKHFADGTVALHALDLAFDEGEFVVLLGPSGSGKTTACRVLAGLETPTAGRIRLDGTDVTRLPPRLRGMGMVFQNYALYPHRTVAENIAYPLRIRGVAAAERERRVRAIATLLQLDALLARRPAQLSGGQAQRVAVARALVWEPRLVLMDEPLSNLDALLRLHTRTELKRLHRTLGRTFVFVTHDQEEAMTLGTRIAVLRDGRLEQFAPPIEIWRRPATRFVAEFIGRPAMNTLEGQVRAGRFEADGVGLPLPGAPDGPLVIGVRPEHLTLAPAGEAAAHDGVVGVVDVVEAVPPDTLVMVRVGGVTWAVRVAADTVPWVTGAPVRLHWAPDALHRFDAGDGRRID